MNYNEEILLKEICRKEIEFRLYDLRLNDIPIYRIIRRDVREQILKDKGLKVMNGTIARHVKDIIKSVLVSFFQFCKIFVCRRKYQTVFFSFPRIEKIGDVFVDKFTDPIIDICFQDDNYIIFEHAIGGRHIKNRAHKHKIVYFEFIDVLEEIIADLFYRFYLKRHSDIVVGLKQKLNQAFNIDLSEKNIGRTVYYFMVLDRITQMIFRRLSVKRVMGPSRDFLSGVFCAAHKTNVRSFEFQHGVTYGESVMYSGYQEKWFTPDFFLAFGDNKPSNVYGIDESRIVNIGWALNDFISKLPSERYEENDILVISDPEVTDSILNAVLQLADCYPQCTFYIRPHPHEIIGNNQMNLINGFENIKIQDNKINISIVLQGFTHIIGENSTVLYEALAVSKKVGKLFFDGLTPKYLSDEDKDSFWEIRNKADFELFLKQDIVTKKSKCIYSPFNKELFCKTVGL